RKRAYCLKIQPATGSFARNLIYSTKPSRHGSGRFTDTHTGRSPKSFVTINSLRKGGYRFLFCTLTER
ncbi:hypothetical protein, partial [Klebsiella pneumoniae]|uniref:hypothetical protein n=1 Tax=Klebsiella pneumoniae TaxID=573 RepID=UPI0019D28022